MVAETPPAEPPFGGVPKEKTIIENEQDLVIEGTPMPIEPSPPSTQVHIQV